MKNTVPWTYVNIDLNGEEIVGSYSENEIQKTNQKEFRFQKVIKKKGNKLYVKWKEYNSSFNICTDKKGSYKTSQYFPPYRSSGGKIKVELDLSSYASKTELKMRHM